MIVGKGRLGHDEGGARLCADVNRIMHFVLAECLQRGGLALIAPLVKQKPICLPIGSAAAAIVANYPDPGSHRPSCPSTFHLHGFGPQHDWDSPKEAQISLGLSTYRGNSLCLG